MDFDSGKVTGRIQAAKFFICLLVDAQKRKDNDKYKKLYNSPKKRRWADINRIDQALKDMEKK